MRSSHRRLAILVLSLAVVGLGAWWTHRRFEAQLDDGRAQTLARLLATSHTPRLVEAPGVEAWLLDLLREVGVEEQLLRPSHDVPTQLDPVGQLLHTRPTLQPSSAAVVQEVPSNAPQSLRQTKHIVVDGETFVLDRRRNLFESQSELGPELRAASAHLAALARAWSERTDGQDTRLIRLYAVMEDGSFLSRPFPSSAEDALQAETQQSQRRPGDPNLVSSAVFREFDFSGDLHTQTHYSGIYADVGGSGFIATVSVPVWYPETRNRLVLAADIAADVELARLENTDGPQLRIITEPVTLADPRSPWWQPWSTLAKSLRPDAPEALRREVQVRALRESRENAWAPQAPVAHHRLENGRGALFAVQVSRDRWLVGWTMQTAAPMPWGPMLLVPGLLLAFLVVLGRRWAREEAEHEATRAAFDLLEVPLVVVDPNDDTVVRANPAARAMGWVPGETFADSVDPDYRQGQQGAGRRRAYGTRVRTSDEPSRFALVRSVSLRDPAMGLGAAAHHRLGLVCVVEDDLELSPVLDEHRAAARRDERNRLAALLDHGADTLARVLASQLERANTESSLAFCRWLAEYLLRRLHVSQWVLRHWNGEPRHEAERIIGPEHLRGTLDQHARIFALVRDDPHLRARLHWNNGVLAAPSADDDALVLETWIDWPDEYRLTVPADGVFGFLLGELLVNAVKHGVPGTRLELEVEVDRGRRELILHLRNTVEETPQPDRPEKAYGGRAIAAELARLCGWALTLERDRDTFHARLRCPLTQRGGAKID